MHGSSAAGDLSSALTVRTRSRADETRSTGNSYPREAAIATIFDWSATPSSNTTIDGIGVNTGMSPANVDNVFRSLAAAIRNSFASVLQAFFAGTAALPLANGGTGATTAPAALAALGGLSIDYQRLIVSTKAAAFNPAVGESGTGYNYSGAAAAMTLNPNATTALTPGDAFVIRNAGTGALTITRGAGVILWKNGSATSADAVLAIGGVASLVYWGGDSWTVTGTGIS